MLLESATFRKGIRESSSYGGDALPRLRLSLKISSWTLVSGRAVRGEKCAPRFSSWDTSTKSVDRERLGERQGDVGFEK